MSFHRLTHERGFTLIELMISMTLMLLLLFSVLDSFDTFSANAQENERRSEASQRARLGADQLARDLRNLASPGQNTAALELATRDDMVFKAVDPIGPNAGLNSANMARVRYCLSDGNSMGQRVLWKQWQTWTTSTPPARPTTTSCPAPVTAGTYGGVSSPIAYNGSARLADSLVNSGSGNNCAFKYPATCSSNNMSESARLAVSALKVNMMVDVKPEVGPPDPITGQPTTVHPRKTQLETGVALRNQNRVPTAAFTASAVGSRQIILNGSTSLDPEGAPLQYSWTVTRNATTTELPTGRILEYSAPAAGVYTFNLRVTDPAGLYHDAPVQTVTVS